MHKKLREGHFLRFDTDGWGPTDFSPHLAYANCNFTVDKPKKNLLPLLRWLDHVGPLGWREEKTLQYLKAHQQQFRNCIEWLSRDAITQLSELRDNCEDLDDCDFDFNAREYLVGVPAVQFLQRHALDHMNLEFGHHGQDQSPFAGLTLEHGAPRDPLDPICWYLLALLIQDCDIHIRRCRHRACKSYFEANPPQLYCKASCRIKDHTKPREKMRLYMREWREKKKKLARAAARAKAQALIKDHR